MAASFIEMMKAHALVINLLQVLSGKALLLRRLRLTPSDSEPSHLAVFSVDLSNFLIYFVAGINAQSRFLTATVHRLSKQT